MRLRNQEGFTLLEVIAAVGVFAFGMLALCRLQAATVVTNSMSNEMTKANTLIQERMETLMTYPLTDPGNGTPFLKDTDSSGTGHDDGTGVDTNPTRNFGLGYATSNSPTGPNADTGTVLADDCVTINAITNQVTSCAQGTTVLVLKPGAEYRIFQNIAVDVVLPNTRTISLIIMWRDSKNILHRSSLTSIKATGT